MTISIGIGEALAIATAFAVMAGWLWKTHYTALEALQRAVENQKELTSHRLATSQEYASTITLKAVEERLTKAVETMGSTMTHLSERIDALLTVFAQRSP